MDLKPITPMTEILVTHSLTNVHASLDEPAIGVPLDTHSIVNGVHTILLALVEDVVDVIGHNTTLEAADFLISVVA